MMTLEAILRTGLYLQRIMEPDIMTMEEAKVTMLESRSTTELTDMEVLILAKKVDVLAPQVGAVLPMIDPEMIDVTTMEAILLRLTMGGLAKGGAIQALGIASGLALKSDETIVVTTIHIIQNVGIMRTLMEGGDTIPLTI